MNPLIERYLYDVVRRLPEAERDEVKKELEANIADMLSEDPCEEEIGAVLTKLGSPSNLADRYRQQPRYLISPALFDTYLIVLKQVTLLVALAVGFAMALVELLQAQDAENLTALIASILGGVIGGAVQGASASVFWVTLGFAIAERKGVQQTRDWTIDDLPELPDDSGVSLPRSRTIVGMALTIFFTCALLLAITRHASMLILVRGSEVIHPFAQEALHRIIPYLVVLACLSLAVSGMKLYYERWTTPLCLANLLYNVIWTSVVIFILHWPDLWSVEFTSLMERLLSTSARLPFSPGWSGLLLIISCSLILVALFDSAESIWNTYKSGKRK